MKKIEFIMIMIINVILILFESNILEACIAYLKISSYYREVFVMLKSMCLSGIVLSVFTIAKLILRRR